MTQPMDDQIGGALGRINNAIRSTFRVETDGTPYTPSNEVEDIAAALGFAPNRPGPEEVMTAADLYGPFVRDEKMAAWHRAWHLGTALRVLTKAGADPQDVAVLREALGVEERDESDVDRIDDHNEQNRRHWIEEFQRGQAIAIANARRDEHRKTVEQVHAELNSDTPPPDLSGPSMTISSAYYAESGQTVTIRGVLAGVSKRTTTHGRGWASATVRDGRSQIVVLVFPNRYTGAEGLLVDGADVVVTGRLERRDGPAQIMAASVQAPAEEVAP